MPYSQATLNNIRGMVKDIGVDATANRLGISRETIRRATRIESRRESIMPKESVQSKDSLIESLSERFSRRELQAIAGGGLCSQKIVRPKFQQTSGKFVLGVMTDTHFGSVYTSTELVAMAFDEFKKAGVNAIVIAGDVTEGLSSRAGHVFELTHVGFKAQLDHAVEMLSQWTYSPTGEGWEG